MKENQRMDTRKVMFLEWISTLAVFVSCFLFLLFRVDKMETHIKELSTQQTNRTDKLYEMFIDLLKERK